ncbi:glycosyltransferase [Microbacterium lacticum]
MAGATSLDAFPGPSRRARASQTVCNPTRAPRCAVSRRQTRGRAQSSRADRIITTASPRQVGCRRAPKVSSRHPGAQRTDIEELPVTVAPRVSIVIPLFNDEEFIEAAIDSCSAQTLADIEIICVDDASTDGTVAVVERLRANDARIRLIRQAGNRSAFQARREGIKAATAPYVLFLDGDDELAPEAAQKALAKAQSSGADVVGVGVEIVAPDEGFPRKFEAALQPAHRRLSSPEIVPTLFPAGSPANGHLWRYLYATPLLRAAYADLAEDLAFYRANDLPIAFLALAHAKTYVSIPDRLYRYHFRRGTSGHRVDGVERFQFLLSGVDPISAIAGSVRSVAAQSGAPDALWESYESARLHIIGNVLRCCIQDTRGELQQTCLGLLEERVGSVDLIRAAASFAVDALSLLSAHTDAPPVRRAEVRSVLITTAHLDTGGLQGVLLEQAAVLANAGCQVTIAVMRRTTRDIDLPAGVDLVHIDGDDLLARLDRWRAVCAERTVDAVIDHHILYNDNWPWYALIALADGIPTIGWIHNFALRPLFDGSRRASFLHSHLRLLAKVVTLSPTDVAYWKLQGVDNVVYLPNPPSPLALAALDAGKERVHDSGARLELAWWGRLDPTTKQVQHLVEVAEELRTIGIDFRLRIIGPDSASLTAAQVLNNATARGVDDAVELLGERDADGLLAALADVHLLVLTSAIEGSPLTIIEAQSLGLPIAMYDLPWLVSVRDNPGVVTTPPGDPAALAAVIADIARDPQRYAAMSQAARRFGEAAAAIDFAALTSDLLAGRLSDQWSPEPTIDDAQLLLQWMVRFSDRNIRLGRGKGGGAEAASLRRERDRAVRKLEQITRGPSFRTGRALTWLPRKVMALRQRAHRTSKPKPPTPAPPRAPGLASDPHRPTRAKNPDVSVVIPVYNAAPWLEECLSSVLAQSGVELEVICVNDGSTDESAAILHRIAGGDARVHVLDQPNSGQSVGRNKGISAASGRYTVFLDSDDYWAGDHLATLVRRADEAELDLLLFDCVTFRDGDVDEGTWQWYSTYYQRTRGYRQPTSGAELMAAMRRGRDYRPHVGLYLARTEFLRRSEVRFIPGIVHQDNPFTFRLLLNARRAAHVRADVYARRIRPGSTITSLTPDRSARGYFLSYVEMMRERAKLDVPAHTSDAIDDIVDYVYEGARKQLSLVSPETAEKIRTLDDRDDAQATFATLMEANK